MTQWAVSRADITRCRDPRCVSIASIVKQPLRQKLHSPLFFRRRGDSPVFPFYFLPPARGGWRAEKAHCPTARAVPDCSGWAWVLQALGAHDASARASRRATAASSACAFYGGRPQPAVFLTAQGGAPSPPRGAVASHTRECRVPPHLVRRLGRSAPQSTGLHTRIVHVTNSVNSQM
jgi:hypothetical protein